MSSPKTTTQENKPPEWAKPLFEQSAGEAMKLYNSGQGGNVYTGDTTAGLGGLTRGGISDVRQAVDGLGAKTSSGKNLLQMASGQYLKSGNPYFNDALKGQLGATADQVQSSFAGAGRYGSGANTGVLTQELGNIRANALSDQFNRDTQNMLTANSQIDTANSNLFQNRLQGSQAEIGAGKLLDSARQAELDAALQRFQAKDNKGWTRLGLLQSAAAGSAGNYGTNTQTQSGGNNLLSALGGVGALATK